MFVLEYLLSMTDTSLIRIGTNTQITLVINHTEDFTKIKGPFNTKMTLYLTVYNVCLLEFILFDFGNQSASSH